jgi:thioredoxin-related protein
MRNLFRADWLRNLGRSVFTALLCVFISPMPSSGCGAAWSSEFANAARRALMSQHPILIIFMGSDWDEMSQRLDRDVLKHRDFGGYTKLNFVLLKVDFPQQQLQPPDVQASNVELAARYKIKSFPTLLLVGATGNEVARTVYRGETYEEFTAMFDHLKQNFQPPKASI